MKYKIELVGGGKHDGYVIEAQACPPEYNMPIYRPLTLERGTDEFDTKIRPNRLVFKRRAWPVRVDGDVAYFRYDFVGEW